MSKQTLEVHQEIFINCSPAQLWDFFINQEGLKQWFNAKVFDVDVFEGGELKFNTTRGGQPYHILGETGLLQKNRKLVFTWIEQNQWGQKWFTPTNVTFEMIPADSGTLFSIHHNGFKYLPEADQTEVCRQYQEYWSKVTLPRLKSIVGGCRISPSTP